MAIIQRVTGREILNARGKPTVEAKVFTSDGHVAVASVPSGTSRGKYEAHELYDGGSRYGGYGARRAAANVSGEINDALRGMDVTDQRAIDAKLIALDGTANKERLGGNAILAASVAAAKAGAMARGIPLYDALEGGKRTLPDVVATVIAGGEFSTSGLEFEDYLYIFHGFTRFDEMLEALVILRKTLEKRLREKYGDFPEDGGALAAPLSSTEEAFETMMAVARECGFENHVTLGLDVAASELLNPQTGCYKVSGREITVEELSDYYVDLCERYPLTFLEDPFGQDDFEAYTALKKRIPGRQLIGDDLFVTNVQRLKTGIEHDCANGILLKINQIGTVTEAIDASKVAAENGMDVTVSLRSGETTDDFIADLAVAIGARQIKLGSPVRAERNAKYNRLLEIEQELLGSYE